MLHPARAGIVSLILLLASPVQAALTTFEGNEVTYHVNLDALWMSNLTAEVVGNTLQFIGKSNKPIFSDTQIGHGFTGHSLESALGDIQVQAKKGYQFSGANIINSGTLNAAGEGNRSSILLNRIWTYAFFSTLSGEQIAATEKHSALISDQLNNPDTTIGTLNSRLIQTNYPVESFSSLISGSKLNIELFNEVHSVVSRTTSQDSFASTALNSFGVSMQVAPVPEPETYALMGMGLLGIIVARRKKKV